MLGFGRQPSDFATKVVVDGTADLVVDKSTLDCPLSTELVHLTGQGLGENRTPGDSIRPVGQWRMRERLSWAWSLVCYADDNADCSAGRSPTFAVFVVRPRIQTTHASWQSQPLAPNTAFVHAL